MASLSDILFTILINGIPLLLLTIPTFVGRKKLWNKIYTRLLVGLLVYFVVYLVLPSMFQIDAEHRELVITDPANATRDGVNFVIWRSLSMTALYFQYPFILLPIVFVMSPLVALVFLWNRLRKEEGTMKDKLDELVFEIRESPRDFFKRELMSGSWQEEKELLKLFIVLLPISLYLLSVILDITTKSYGLEMNFLSVNSPLGWFLEIFFVYLAAFLMGIHLLYRSRVSFKGRFLGENLRTRMFDSLTSVGAPISILSIVLFLVNYSDSLLIIFYFFAYFIMAAVIFVMLLKIFMPLSILLFVKIVDWWKNAKKSMDRVNWNAGLFSIFTALAGTFLIFGIIVVFGTIFGMVSPWTNQTDLLTNLSPGVDMSLSNAVRVEQSIVLDAVRVITWVLVLAGFLWLGTRGKRDVGVSTFIYVGILYAFSLLTIPLLIQFPLNFAMDQLWVSTTPAWTEAFGFRFYAMRTVFFTTEFTDPVLYFLALPYSVLNYASAVVLWGLLIYYFKKDFKFQSLNRDGVVKRIAFSSYAGVPTRPELASSPESFLISKVKDVTAEKLDGIDPGDREVLEKMNDNLLGTELIELFGGDSKAAYRFLRRGTLKGVLRTWIPEFSYSFQEAKLSTLHLMYSDGRDVFFYQFPGGTVEADPALVSGMFSAITSFIKETTKSSELLRTIDHGDVKLIIEYGKYVFGAIFADRETTEVRGKLIEFINRFEEKHGDLLANWTGRTDPFEGDGAIVEEIFEI
ncbi:MAG: hypothetical protein ACTSU5_06685 [Promethearchaeota archaeon]